MNEEFCLSDKLGVWATSLGLSGEGLGKEDVKEFIKRFEEEIKKLARQDDRDTMRMAIINLAGEKLI